MRFFTADPHFSEEKDSGIGILKRCNRPYKSIPEMDKGIIKIWNKQADKTDTIYVLGDFIGYGIADKNSWKKSINLVKKIKAKVALVLGNKEEALMKERFDGNFEKMREYFKKAGFFEVYKGGVVLEMLGQNFYLNHYPKNKRDDMFNLFGHIHKTCFAKPYGFNVGVDTNFLSLYSEDDIKFYLEIKEKYYDENVWE